MREARRLVRCGRVRQRHSGSAGAGDEAPCQELIRLRELFLRPPTRLRERRDDFRGTLPPFSRASLRPIAIACLRLLTRAPDPLFSVPVFRRCIADSTRFAADLPYFAMNTSATPRCKQRARGTAL